MIATAAAGAAQTPGQFRLQEATIAAIQQAIETKQITTVGVVELYLKRIKAYNGTCVNEPQGILGPITTIPQRRPDQRALDAEPAARGAHSLGLRRAQGAQPDRSRSTTRRTCPMRSKPPRRRTGSSRGPDGSSARCTAS